MIHTVCKRSHLGIDPTTWCCGAQSEVRPHRHARRRGHGASKRSSRQTQDDCGLSAEFGTAHSQRLAGRERDALAKRFGKDLQKAVVLELDAIDRDYKITSAPMSEQAATAACETLKHWGRSCTVVQVAS